MSRIEDRGSHWWICGGKLELDIDKKSGVVSRLVISRDGVFEWTNRPGDVVVRDDKIGKYFGNRDISNITFDLAGGTLKVKKTFHGADWQLVESYCVKEDAIGWEAEVCLDSGEFRSCQISYQVTWPGTQDHQMKFWAAKENMPSAPHRFAGISLEYGEVTSGIMMPALCCYREDKKAGLLMTMPFDFRTPRMRFVSNYRDPELKVEFDWLALSAGKPARANLLMRGTGGNWRPALGWLYERFKEYFEPRSELIHSLWGGHTSGTFDISLEDAKGMVDLGLTWEEIHAHFPAYGNYHPEGMDSWRSGHEVENEKLITVDIIRQTIKNLHEAGAAALPYIQVTGDGDIELLDPAFDGSRARDIYGDKIVCWPKTETMNSDPSLPFGKDITRQIDGMLGRYPDIDGVFLDQACYNFLDTAHHDGITAFQNRPCYMTGFNYYPHLEHLSRLLHPKKVIIANGTRCIGIMKYIDAVMSEGSGWLCDQFQYYSLAKPMFFLMYESADRSIEMMFQQCIRYAAGYTSYLSAKPSKDLYTKYRPLLERLFRRKWVFDPDPLKLPPAFEGDLYRGANGSLLAGIVSSRMRLAGRTLRPETVCAKTADTETVERVTLQLPGGAIEDIPFKIDDGAVQFDIPGDTAAAVAELHPKKK